jgi:hypothetical protein
LVDNVLTVAAHRLFGQTGVGFTADTQRIFTFTFTFLLARAGGLSSLAPWPRYTPRRPPSFLFPQPQLPSIGPFIRKFPHFLYVPSWSKLAEIGADWRGLG